MERKFIILGFIGFFLGVFLRSFFNFSLEVAALLLIIGIFLGALFYFQKNLSLFIFYSAVLFSALSLGILRYEFQDQRADLSEFYGSAGKRVGLSGAIISDPERTAKFTRAVFEVSGAKILLTVPHYPEVRYGDRLKLNGILNEPKNFSGDSGFDWKAYLAKDNIYFEMFLPEILENKGPNFSLAGGAKRILYSAKHKFVGNLLEVLPEPHGSFLAGITIGERTSLPDDLEEKFRKVGVIHIIVLSGYNISIIADNVLKIIGYLPLAKTFRTMLATIGIILFAILTGASATVVRAAIMGILLLWARETGKIYQALSALIFAAFLMVVINPKVLRFDASFQLSFLATFGLIFLVPRIEKYFTWFPNFWRLRENLVSTISTQIFVMPLLISMGGSFSWVMLPANLLILSAIPLSMFLGFLTGFFGFFSYYLSWVASWPAFWLAEYQLLVVNFFSSLLQ